MWILMTTCYALMAASFAGLGLVGLQGYLKFRILGAGHPQVALGVTMLYLFTETLVMFFFIGTGVNIKDYLKEHGGDVALYGRVRKLKQTLFPQMMLSILLVGVVFIMGGAVDRKLVPGWSHGVLFIAAILHFARLVVLQHRAFRVHTNTILEMCGVTRGAAAPAEEE